MGCRSVLFKKSALLVIYTLSHSIEVVNSERPCSEIHFTCSKVSKGASRSKHKQDKLVSERGEQLSGPKIWYPLTPHPSPQALVSACLSVYMSLCLSIGFKHDREKGRHLSLVSSRRKFVPSLRPQRLSPQPGQGDVGTRALDMMSFQSRGERASWKVRMRRRCASHVLVCGKRMDGCFDWREGWSGGLFEGQCEWCCGPVGGLWLSVPVDRV